MLGFEPTTEVFAAYSGRQEIPNRDAMPLSVSPDRTVQVRATSAVR